ncbi:MAG: N-6 DNA methylase [Candidatus Lokiarchaeota archaeon]|nr:N-6 DNA methylase [Candidatus Lokiarchaeota archaeon]
MENFRNYFEKEITSLKKLFTNYQLVQTKEYKKWKIVFGKFYFEKNVNSDLYTYFSVIYFFCYYLIAKFGFKSKFRDTMKDFKQQLVQIIQKTSNTYPKLNSDNIEYFNPILHRLSENNFSSIYSIIKKLSDIIESKNIKYYYYLDFAIQNLIPSHIRHNSGEFYTPPFLTEKMVQYSYEFGDKVLDPCCGSGNFLLAIIQKILKTSNSKEQKIEWINKIFGYDINPISIFISKCNLFLLLKEDFSYINNTLHNINSLNPNGQIIKKKYDLIIGNPPWYTLRDINSVKEQEFIKNLAESLIIKPRAKNILNTEIATLFFYQAHKMYLKEGGKIFFVLSEGILNGSHASRFRNFHDLEDVKIWSFSDPIQKTFNVNFICLYAKKKLDNNNYQKEIINCIYGLKNNSQEVNYFKNISLKLVKQETLVPFDSIKKNGKTYTKKLIPKERKNELGNLKESYYKDLFHKGADLNPRNLIFVDIEDINNKYYKINPDERIFKRAKAPWKKREFNNEIVEKKYIFKVIKSTELVKFFIFDQYNVFIPITREKLQFNYAKLQPKAKIFYDKINEIYMNLKKRTTKNNSLMDNLDRWSKLCNERQKARIKVVYNNSGSILKAAVLKGDLIITGDLSFYDSNSLEEAYYLSAILNSPLLTKKVRIMKSSRHIFKIPFNLPIQKFNQENKHHQELAYYGKLGEKEVRTLYNLTKTQNTTSVSKRKLEKQIAQRLDPLLGKINEIIRESL